MARFARTVGISTLEPATAAAQDGCKLRRWRVGGAAAVAATHIAFSSPAKRKVWGESWVLQWWSG